MKRRVLKVKRVGYGEETEKWGEAKTNVEQVALGRPTALRSFSKPSWAWEQKPCPRLPGSSGRAAAEARSPALSKVHSFISIPPCQGSPGLPEVLSHCFVNVYRSWKTAGTQQGRPHTQTSTEGTQMPQGSQCQRSTAALGPSCNWWVRETDQTPVLLQHKFRLGGLRLSSTPEWEDSV